MPSNHHTKIAIAVLVALGAVALPTAVTLAQSPAQVTTAVRAIPDFGITLNEDGDMALLNADADPAIVAQKMNVALDTLKGTGVKTLTYQIGCGSDILHFPTKVASTWGWRTTTKEESDPIWKERMSKMRPAAEAGLDSIRIAADWAKANDVLFVPSYRINDAHYVADPMNNPLTGKFWVDNHEKLELKRSPVNHEHTETYKHLLDFTHAEVRAYRLGVMIETIERYADTMAGFQIDFMRHPALFQPEDVSRGTPLMTEMIASVRAKLNELESKNGRTYALWVRVPPTIEHSKKIGLNIERWMKDGLVDVVTPSPAMTLSYDLPVDEFAKLGKAQGITIYPSPMNITQFAWPFTFEPTAEFYAPPSVRDPSAAMYRGFTNNMHTLGATNVELYNFNVPLSETESHVAKAALDPMAGDRIYAVTPRYWIDTTGAFEPVKQLPATLKTKQASKFTIVVGEDLSKNVEAALRIGVSHDEGAARVGQLRIRANGQTIYDGPASAIATPVAGLVNGRGVKNHPPIARVYLQTTLKNPAVFKPGRNTIELTIREGTLSRDVIIGEIQIGVRSVTK